MSRPRLIARNVSRDVLLAEQVENGSSFWAKFMGLMGRASLPSGNGLWLPGENGIHMLFMRFAIDVVFVTPPDGGPEGRRRVLFVGKSVRPWRGVVWHVGGAKGVLELPAGTLEATGTAVGDEVTIGPA
jgi:uncharacterized membrane protein (UPF0127 family)